MLTTNVSPAAVDDGEMLTPSGLTRLSAREIQPGREPPEIEKFLSETPLTTWSNRRVDEKLTRSNVNDVTAGGVQEPRADWTTKAHGNLTQAIQARQGGTLHATGRVVRGGKRIIVTTAEVVHVAADGSRSDCALMQQTLLPVAMAY